MTEYKLGVGRGRHKPQWNKEMATVTVEYDENNDLIIVQMPYDEDAKEDLKAKFKAKWDPDDKTWYIDARMHSLEDVEKEIRVHFRNY